MVSYLGQVEKVTEISQEGLLQYSTRHIQRLRSSKKKKNSGKTKKSHYVRKRNLYVQSQRRRLVRRVRLLLKALPLFHLFTEHAKQIETTDKLLAGVAYSCLLLIFGLNRRSKSQ